MIVAIKRRCSCCKRFKLITEFGKDKHNKNGLRSYCKECNRNKMRGNYQKNKEAKRQYRMDRPEIEMYRRAKIRAKKMGLPFTITTKDIHVPDVCPYLGIPLYVKQDNTTTGAAEHSPSLDRIIPELGYVVGNIEVISFLANMMKSKATPEQLLRFAETIIERQVV